MRGTPIHRTILVWICILSLASADLAKRCVDDILDAGLVIASGHGSR